MSNLMYTNNKRLFQNKMTQKCLSFNAGQPRPLFRTKQKELWVCWHQRDTRLDRQYEGLHADHYRHCPIATMWPDLMKSHYIGKIRNFVGGNFWRLQLLFGKNIMPLGKFSLKLLMADYFKKSSHLVTLYCKHNFTATQRTTRLWHLVAF